MDLHSADIDDAAPAADEVVALAAPLDDVAGVDEAVVAGERRRARADIARRRTAGANSQRALDDPHLDAVARSADEGGGKAGEAVIDVESDARFGRSIGVADARMRKHCAQGVEDRLVGDLAESRT